MRRATAKDLRQKTTSAELVDSVRRGREVVIAPMAFGMWRRRRDMRDVERWLDSRRASRVPR